MSRIESNLFHNHFRQRSSDDLPSSRRFDTRRPKIHFLASTSRKPAYDTDEVSLAAGGSKAAPNPAHLLLFGCFCVSSVADFCKSPHLLRIFRAVDSLDLLGPLDEMTRMTRRRSDEVSYASQCHIHGRLGMHGWSRHARFSAEQASTEIVRARWRPPTMIATVGSGGGPSFLAS